MYIFAFKDLVKNIFSREKKFTSSHGAKPQSYSWCGCYVQPRGLVFGSVIASRLGLSRCVEALHVLERLVVRTTARRVVDIRIPIAFDLPLSTGPIGWIDALLIAPSREMRLDRTGRRSRRAAVVLDRDREGAGRALADHRVGEAAARARHHAVLHLEQVETHVVELGPGEAARDVDPGGAHRCIGRDDVARDLVAQAGRILHQHAVTAVALNDVADHAVVGGGNGIGAIRLDHHAIAQAAADSVGGDVAGLQLQRLPDLVALAPGQAHAGVVVERQVADDDVVRGAEVLQVDTDSGVTRDDIARAGSAPPDAVAGRGDDMYAVGAVRTVRVRGVDPEKTPFDDREVARGALGVKK